MGELNNYERLRKRKTARRKKIGVMIFTAVCFFITAVMSAFFVRAVKELKSARSELVSVKRELDEVRRNGGLAVNETTSEADETDPSGDAEQTAQEDPEETSGAVIDYDDIEKDPRYSVTENFKNLGIIHNVNNYLNIRKEPDMNSISVGKAMKNTAFEVLEKTDNGWYLIQSGNDTGYVKAEYVATGEEGTVLAMEKCTHSAFAGAENTKIYKSANVESDVVFEAMPENGYTVLDMIGDWVKVTITDGLQGYVKKKDVDIRYTLNSPIFFTDNADVSEDRLNIINYAFEFYGDAYVWGGTTLGEGVDCSGYTMRIYEHFGIPMPRLSYEQAEWGTEVASMDDILPGDLVFFHGYRNGNVTEGVGHVAIYIGQGKMIHAASERRGITVDNYNFMGEPLCIRRVVDDSVPHPAVQPTTAPETTSSENQE